MPNDAVYFPDTKAGEHPCSNCVFSVPGISDDPEEGPILKCHRFPPVVLPYDGAVIQTWPDAIDWCGEYHPRGMYESDN